MTSQAGGTGAGSLTGMRILIAEDDWLIADTLAVLLEEQGAQIVGPSPDTGHAIALLNASEVINFALVDMNLRDCFSDELIHNLNDRNIPFAIITAYHALPTNCGDRAVATLLKPVDHRKLFKLLSLYARGSTAV
jgi:DNA-binding NtrC family response regulator